MGIEVRRLGGDEWRDWREVRLRALADSPGAFGSDLDREQAFTEADWRQRASGSFVAYLDDRPIALGGGFLEDGRVSVVAMWTDPERRGRGVGGQVLDAVVAMAAERGLDARLFVMRDNPDVARLYERHGFRRTGRVEEHGGRLAEEMVLVGPGGDPGQAEP